MEVNYEDYISLPDLSEISESGRRWIDEAMPGFSISGMVEDITKGESVIDPKGIWETVMKIFANEIYSAVKLLAVISAVIILGAILENLRSAFGKNGFNAAGAAAVGIICGLSAELFGEMCRYAQSVTGDITFIMAALLPVLITLTAGGGFAVTGSIEHPILLLMCNVFANIFDKILIPLSIAYMAISMLDAIGGNVKLKSLRNLIRKIYNFIVGIVMTFFTGILSISGFAAVALDGLGAKGARFAVSNMVPIVGGSISDAMSAVASACIVLKSAVGVAGIAAIAAVCLTPIIKIGAVVLAMRVCAAICEPVADNRAIDIISASGDSLSMINAAVISTGVMMIIAASIIIGVKP